MRFMCLCFFNKFELGAVWAIGNMVKKNNQKNVNSGKISNKMSLDHGKPFRLTSQQLSQTEIPSIHMGSKHTHATHSDSKTNIDYIYIFMHF